MDCERCGAELPEGGNFCSNCGAPRPSPADAQTPPSKPCRKCTEAVEVGAAFCWNCGVESPHEAPAVTGNTEVRKAPPKPDRFEWDDSDNGEGPALVQPDAGTTMRRGSGSPPLVPAEPTEPKEVGTGLPVAAKASAAEEKHPAQAPEMKTSFEQHDTDEPATAPRKVVSLIAEELGSEAQDRPLTPVDDEGSEPLSLDSHVDAVVSGRAKVWPNLSEEIAELQLLLLRGFEAEARDAWRLLADAHPGHPDLETLGAELGVDDNGDVTTDMPRMSTGDDTPSEFTPEITKVTPRASEDDDAPAPIETPTSPSFVEGTAPPPGGFKGVPVAVEPNHTPHLGIESPSRMHRPSSDSLPTNPRMSAPAVRKAGEVGSTGVRMVMLGARGESVWEHTLPFGEVLVIGREPQKPWGDDPHMESTHVRLHSTAQGVRVEPLGNAGVYRQVDERLAVRDGDEYRVGESLLHYSAGHGGWGTITWYPLSGESGKTVAVGGAGVRVGRENCDIEIPEDTFVSGAHCQFSCRDDGLFVEDLGSANGTYTRVRSGEAVGFGGLVLVGQTQFKVRRNG
ncbi:MAG: FHA domain-containing protein [Nannocystaceae bacterium]|nr:FHA domain-containing protein [bacterium]